jgi:hypothetical protein
MDWTYGIPLILTGLSMPSYTSVAIALDESIETPKYALIAF